MYRAVFYAIFIVISLNGSQISGVDTTKYPETSSSSSITSTETSESNLDDSSLGKLETTSSVASTETSKSNADNSSLKAETNITHTESDIIQNEDEDQTERTTQSVNNNQNDVSTKDPVHKLETENQKADDFKETLLNLPEWMLKDEQETNGTIRQFLGKRPEPGFLEKLTGNLGMPALKAKSRLIKAWNQTSKGAKDLGGGTYETAAGTLEFINNAAKALLTTG